MVHRVAYEHHRGPIPPGLFVCHSCDVPICVNPDHLFLGTGAENTADKMRKNRHIKGEQVHTAKLMPKQVLEIRSIAGMSMRAISRRYGVTHGAVSRIIGRKTWTHL